MSVAFEDKPIYGNSQNLTKSGETTKHQKIPITPEKEQEEILKQKYPNVSRSPGSQMLLKRLKGKNNKFFDSADYSAAQMFNQKPTTAEGQADPEKAAQRDQLASLPLKASTTTDVDELPTGRQIPKPDTVPARKTSNLVRLDTKLAPPTLTQPSPLSSPMGEKSPGPMFK